MDCDALRDDQWERIRGFVPGGTKGKRDNRIFLEALCGWRVPVVADEICPSGLATIAR